MVEETAGRPDDDGRAALERALLRRVADAAVDRDLARMAVLAETAELARHLDRELAGGDHDERLGLAQLGIDSLEDRDAESGRLAGPGLGLGKEITPALEDRDGLRLDGRRRHVAEIGDGAEDVRVELEFAETCVFRRLHWSERHQAVVSSLIERV